MPENDAVAAESHQGAASPARAGTHSTPSLDVAAQVSSWSAPMIRPSWVIQRTADAAV